MAKKAVPIITQTEILSRAIRSIEAEIEEWRCKSAILPQDMIDKAIEEPAQKLEALKTLYRIETGNCFD